MSKRRYAAIGTGSRISMFIDPIVGTYSDVCNLVGICDSSTIRAKYHQDRLKRVYGVEIPIYRDFEKMLSEQTPQTVIVCTPDHCHHEFIIKSLEFGADVISEKPLTTDEVKCREILEAVERFGGSVRTTFNLRWSPALSKIREIIANGAIGTVKHVDFEYFLNTSHGADYFRRWHSEKRLSGGLLVHKSTHHFDLINWWIDGIPKDVFAMGDLVYYGKKNAVTRGDGARSVYSRYTNVQAAKGDPFRYSLDDDDEMRKLYLEAEEETGYIRDRNVFREGIDIEDSMSVLIRYRCGAMATYSLNAYSPKEGFRASISGDGGRIEYTEEQQTHLLHASNPPSAGVVSRNLIVQPLFSQSYHVDVPEPAGGHGGGDPLIQEQMFSCNPSHDSLMRNAGHEQGAISMLVGAAANKSLIEESLVRIDDLINFDHSLTRLSQLV